MDMSRPERCLLGSNDRSCADPDFFAAFESSHRRDYAGYLRKNKPEGTAYLGMLAALLYHLQKTNVFIEPQTLLHGAIGLSYILPMLKVAYHNEV